MYVKDSNGDTVFDTSEPMPALFDTNGLTFNNVNVDFPKLGNEEVRYDNESCDNNYRGWYRVEAATWSHVYDLGPANSDTNVYWVKIRGVRTSLPWLRRYAGSCDSVSFNYFVLFPENKWISLNGSMLLEVSGAGGNNSGPSHPWLTRMISVYRSGSRWKLEANHSNRYYYDDDITDSPSMNSSDVRHGRMASSYQFDIRILPGRFTK